MSTDPAATLKRGHEDDMHPTSHAKKPRQEDASGEPRRDEEFWEDDGIVILVARNVEFRFHKSVLAYHSPVFADMFSLPQPTEVPTSDDSRPRASPVVHLDDSPEDMRHIFRAILPRKESQFIANKNHWHYPTFATISAYARLGHKYHIDHLVAQTAQFLKGHYTDNFDLWETVSHFEPVGWLPLQVIGVVNLARLLGCHSVLPSALAMCCMLSPTQLLHGFKREDGSQETLDQGDLIRCLQGKERLMKEGISSALQAFTCAPTHSPQCKRQSCRPWVDMLRDGVARFPNVFGGVCVLDTWSNYLTGILAGKALCKPCELFLAARLRDEQRKIWNQLPVLMDVQVEGWGLAAQPAKVRSASRCCTVSILLK